MDTNKNADAALTMDEFRNWVARRKAAGTTIDIETCELGWWYGEVFDPYGLLVALGELPDEMRQVCRHHFVRSPESDGWIHEHAYQRQYPHDEPVQAQERNQC